VKIDTKTDYFLGSLEETSTLEQLKKFYLKNNANKLMLYATLDNCHGQLKQMFSIEK